MPRIQGYCDPRFSAVQQAFEQTLAGQRHYGAAVSVICEGQTFVDLSGGWADRAQTIPWARKTRALLFSVSKGLGALGVLYAHSQGWVDYDAPVALYWPEFAQAGKGGVTVQQLLDHQAGLACISEPVTPDLLRDVPRFHAVLAAQVPMHAPGAYYAYHAVSWGWYVDALLSRVVPNYESFSRYLASVFPDYPVQVGIQGPTAANIVAEPVGLESPLRAVSGLWHVPLSLALAQLSPWSEAARAFRLMGKNPQGQLSPDYYGHENPASNVCATATDLVQLFDVLANPPAWLRHAPNTQRCLMAQPKLPSTGTFDRILKTESRFHLGFVKPRANFSFGNPEDCFGAPGLGGGFAMVDVQKRLSYAYVTNELGTYLWDDPRDVLLRMAVGRALSGD
ncbi:MAG: serine hydrolase domain-containing protein [Pseudomonadota bacterium]